MLLSGRADQTLRLDPMQASSGQNTLFLSRAVSLPCVLEGSATLILVSFAYPSQCHPWLFGPTPVETQLRFDCRPKIGTAELALNLL